MTTVAGLSLRTARTVLTTLIVVALLAGVGLSVRRTTTTTTVSRPAANSVPAPAPSAGSPSVAAQPPVTSEPLPVSATAPAVAATSSAPAGGDTTAPTTPASPPPSAIPAVQIASIGECPIKLPTPKNMGGLQSLVAFAPAFGPFSAEAFAAAAAYAPELELLGPILAQYPAFAPILEPLLTPLLSLFATGTNSLFAAIEPLYKPYRTQVLSAETQLATALAPFSAKVAANPLAGCLVDLEASLVGDTSKSKTK